MDTDTLGKQRHKGVWIEAQNLCKISRKVTEDALPPQLWELEEGMIVRIDDRICEIFLHDFTANRYFVTQIDRVRGGDK